MALNKDDDLMKVIVLLASIDTRVLIAEIAHSSHAKATNYIGARAEWSRLPVVGSDQMHCLRAE